MGERGNRRERTRGCALGREEIGERSTVRLPKSMAFYPGFLSFPLSAWQMFAERERERDSGCSCQHESSLGHLRLLVLHQRGPVGLAGLQQVFYKGDAWD